MLVDGSQRVTVSNHDNILVVQDGWADSVMPERKYSINCDLQRLSLRKGVGGQISILWSKSWMPFVINIELRWWDIIRSSPNKNLVFAVLFGSLGFIQALQSAVMSLVESPVLVMRNPGEIKLIRDGVVSLDGSLQDRCESNIKSETLFSQHFAGFNSLCNSVLGKRHILPPGEDVFFIPG
jgi:hypothetical protein